VKARKTRATAKAKKAPAKRKPPAKKKAAAKKASKPRDPKRAREARRFVEDAQIRGAAAPPEAARDAQGELRPGVEIELVPTPEGQAPVRRRFSAA
jgi:hypothetical protein